MQGIKINYPFPNSSKNWSEREADILHSFCQSLQANVGRMFRTDQEHLISNVYLAPELV
jgi:hypothetical protein